MKIILLGPPGSGKGTQAEEICKKFSIVSVSTGVIIRSTLKSGTEQAKKIKECIDSGHLLPDDLVVDIIKERIKQDDCKNGFILDGFPRTIAQAEALDKMGVDIDAVILLELADDCIVSRMSGRRVCNACGATYHIELNKPKKENVCDVCSGILSQRDDDKAQTVKERLKVYHESTEPLIDYYEKKGLLKRINAFGSIEEIAGNINRTLEELG